MSSCKIAWCGTDCLGSVGPGFGARLNVDYVRGWDTELFCSVQCRDVAFPNMRGLTFEALEDWRANWARAPWATP